MYSWGVFTGLRCPHVSHIPTFTIITLILLKIKRKMFFKVNIYINATSCINLVLYDHLFM